MSTGRPHDERPPLSPRVMRRLLPRTLPAVTEYLAAALSGATRNEPDWTEIEWRIARAVAVIHGISPLLSKSLAWAGASGWREFLDSQHSHTARRFLRMSALLDMIDRQAAKAGIPFVPLKGAALHAMGVYAAGERPMADIDLLVSPSALMPMHRVLVALGYRPVSVSDQVHVLVPVTGPAAAYLGEHADNGITVEVHARIGGPMPVRQVEITSGLWPSRPRLGRNDYPSLGALMGHLLMHAAVNMQVRMLRMIQLHDMALLAPRLSHADWNALLSPRGGLASPWWALPPLQLLRHYYPGAVPEGAIEAVQIDCPSLLRMAATRTRLTSVSVSNPRRSVFPALIWAGTWSEAWTSVGDRLRSGVQAVRANTAAREATELQPWIAGPHRRRVFDVLLGRPRPETMMIIAATLQDHPPSESGYEQPKVA